MKDFRKIFEEKNIPLFPWSSQARGFFLKDTEKKSYHPADPNLDEQKEYGIVKRKFNEKR